MRLNTIVHKRIIVGKVIGAFGIKGAVKVKSYTHNPFDITSYGKLQLKNGQYLALKLGRMMKNQFILGHIEGCQDRNQAQTWAREELYIERDQLPALKNDEYYLEDLVGLNVLVTEENIGTVQAFHDFGAGAFLEILLKNNMTATLPFNNEAIIHIDTETSSIRIHKQFLIS